MSTGTGVLTPSQPSPSPPPPPLSPSPSSMGLLFSSSSNTGDDSTEALLATPTTTACQEDELKVTVDGSPINMYDTLQGNVLLNLTYKLNLRNDKFIITGLFPELNCKVGVSFTASKYRRVLFTQYIWNILQTHLDDIKKCLKLKIRNKYILRDITDEPPTLVTVRPNFGKWYVHFVDMWGDTIMLNEDDFSRFLAFLPSISRHFLHLWREENDLFKIITSHFNNNDVNYSKSVLCARLHDELKACSLLHNNAQGEGGERGGEQTG